MATFDAATTGYDIFHTEVSWSHTVADQPDRLLIIQGKHRANSSNDLLCTVDGNPATLVLDMDPGTRVWVVVNPAVGSRTIRIYSPTGSDDAVLGTSVSYYDCNETTPYENAASASTADTAYSVNVTSEDGALVVGGAIVQLGLDIGDWTEGAGQTTRIERNELGASAIMSEEAGASSVTISYTQSEMPFFDPGWVWGMSLPAGGGPPPPPPISFSGNRGTAQNKTSGTSLALTPTDALPVGAVVVVEAVADNIGTANTADTTEHAVSDSAGNTWTKIREVLRGAGTQAAGVTTSLWVSVLDHEITTSGSITLTLASARTAKAMTAREFALGEGYELDLAGLVTGVGNGSSTSPSAATASLEEGEYLLLGLVGRERPDGDTYTQAASWTDRSKFGTTGGTAATNVSMVRGDRIGTFSGVQTYAPSIGTSGDWGAIAAAIPIRLEDTDREGGSTAVVEVVPAGAGAKQASGSSTASVAVVPGGAGAKTGQGSATASLEVVAEGAGTASRQGTATADVEVAATGAGSKTGQGSTTALVYVTPQGSGTRTSSGGTTAIVEVLAEGEGSIVAPEPEGGSTALVEVLAAGEGASARQGGDTTAVGVVPSGSGSRSTSGAAGSVVEVLSAGEGIRAASGSASAVVDVDAAGFGAKHAHGGATAPVGVVPEGQGTADEPPVQGGAVAIVEVLAAGSGSRAASGGATASVAVVPGGQGTRTTSGGATVVVEVTAEGAGGVDAPAFSGGATASVGVASEGDGIKAGVGASSALVLVVSSGGWTRSTAGGGAAVVWVVAEGAGFNLTPGAVAFQVAGGPWIHTQRAPAWNAFQVAGGPWIHTQRAPAWNAYQVAGGPWIHTQKPRRS